METFWQKMMGNLKTGMEVSKEKIEEYSHIGRLKMDLLGARRTRDRLLMELGKKALVYMEAKNTAGFASDTEALALEEKIRKEETTMRELEEQLAEITRKKKDPA